MTTTTTSRADRPALLGGSPAVTLPQDEALRWPIIGPEDEAAVLEVLRSGAVSIHPVVNELEADYRARFGRAHALAHNNGTGALHAAMHAIGLEPGDEVIVQSATWWASVMPILHQGAIPVFAECEAERGGLDPDDVERRITDRTRAIVIVHLFGMPSRTDALLDLARRRGLKVIEDASHAHGASVDGVPCGRFGDVSVFSMQANKLVPSAEGGMLLTDDEGLLVRALRYGHYERLIPMKDAPDRRFAATGFGMKFRMSPLSAALARTQLAKLDERNARRHANCRRLAERLQALGVHAFIPPTGVERTYFEFLVRFDGRDGLDAAGLAAALRAEGAQAEAPRYPLLHQQPMFTEGRWASIARIDPAGRTYDPADLPRTIGLNRSLLRLPAFPNAGEALLDQYATAFEKVIAHAAEVAASRA